MKIRLWGTRGSLPAPGPATVRYGGNTPCVEVRSDDGRLLILDAGTGIARLGGSLSPDITRVDILLTHLHLDHILGIGFFAPLDRSDMTVHVWGPPSAAIDFEEHLVKSVAPPLFPIRLRDLACRLTIHNVPLGRFAIANFAITAALVCHPGPTVGYRIDDGTAILAYLPDHEPALASPGFPGGPAWTSGWGLARDADVLIHDAQYSAAEYAERVGWGHSALTHALEFAALARVRRLVAFHHDPNRSDAGVDRLVAETIGSARLPFRFTAAKEGALIAAGRRRGRA